MRRTLTFFLFAFALIPLGLHAGGAGGLEFTQVVGRDLWPLPGGVDLPSSTGVVSAVGGFGYGVLEDGTVIGGFGLAVGTEGLVVPPSSSGQLPQGFHAGYGGTIQGWQHRWGPLVTLLATRVGFGGADWSEESGWSSPAFHHAGFSLLGGAEAQVGLLLTPWFEVAARAGVMGTMTFVPHQAVLVGYAPTLGFTLAWGAF